MHRPSFRFNPKFYKAIYADMADGNVDCAEHFAQHGAKEGRFPNLYSHAVAGTNGQFSTLLAELIIEPQLRDAVTAQHPGALELAFELIALGDPVDRVVSNFSSVHYLNTYKDIAEAGIDPLTHYLKNGHQEKRRVLNTIRSDVRKGAQVFDPARPTCLICAHEFSRSGAPIVARDMALEAAQTHNVIIMALRAGTLLDEFCETACQVIISATPFEDWDYFDVPELAKIDFAILNSVETFFFIKPLVAAGVPCAAYIHEFYEYILPSYKATFFALFADIIVFSSSVVQDSWQGLLQDAGFDVLRHSDLLAQAQLTFVPVDSEKCIQARARLSAVLGVDCGSRRIVYGAGYMQIRKGTDLFVQAAQQVRDIDPDTLFIWIGDGANHEDIHYGVWLDKHIREARANTPDGNLFMIPAGPYYRDVAAAADILFLPSRLDPLPNVVFDAANNGCTTVLFQGATGFDDDNYNDIPSLVRVGYGDLAAACRAVLRAPRKLSWRRYLSVLGSEKKTTAKEPEIFNTIRKMLDLSAVDFTPSEVSAGHVSILFRDDDEVQTALPRQRETDRLTYLDRRAIWPDLETARQTLATEGSWMHSRSVIEPHEDLTPENVRAADLPPLYIHIHAHYLDDLAHDLSTLAAYRLAHKIIATTNTEIKATRIKAMAADAGVEIEVRVIGNQGRDILPFLHVASDYDCPDDALWCHVHQKKSVTSTSGGDQWRAFLMRLILGDETHVSSAVTRIAQPGTGLVTAFDPFIVGWAGSRRLLPDIERRLGQSLPPTPLLFPVGNMFWTRAGVARDMLNLFGPNYAWPNEPLPNDGTIYHMIERLWPAISAQAKLETVFLDRPDTKRI